MVPADKHTKPAPYASPYRNLTPVIMDDLRHKMVLLMGPRQVGKTTLAKALGRYFLAPTYYNYDVPSDQTVIESRAWLPSNDYVVLDELHKMASWKAFLKGVYDGKPTSQALLVTGSARMDTFRQAGDSLAGRYFSHRLFPFSVKELAAQEPNPVQALGALLRFGGFPEPLLAGNDAKRKRWQKQYFTDLIREDILEFSRVNELRTMRLLLELLRSRTGSALSYASLGRDLSISPATARRYVDILEALHIVFLIHPYHRNIARALGKAPKLYFYDTAYILGDDGARLENTVALSLLKHLSFQLETEGDEHTLHYVQTTSGKEIDFVIADEAGELTHAIEVKWADAKPSFGLRELAAQRPHTKAVQLVYLRTQPYGADGVEVHPAATWLAGLKA